MVVGLEHCPCRITASLIGALCCILAHPASGSTERPARRVAILPLEAVNLEPGEGAQYRQVLARLIDRRGLFARVELARVTRALAGQGAECVRQLPCLRKVGRALGASTLLALRVGRLGDTTVVQLTAFDIERGARIGAWEEVLRVGRPAAIRAALSRMVDRFAPPPVGRSTPWYRKWWVWTLVGTAIAGAVTATVLATRGSADTPDRIIRPPPP